MKFGKLLSKAEENLPDIKHLSLRYKDLKKQLKELTARASEQQEKQASTSTSRHDLSPQEKHFIDTLNEDMKKFNDYFCDKEEEVVMWMQQLDEQCEAATSLKDHQLSHIGYIHLHGQLVLLYHWSMLNYAALVKILKKHDKCTGLLLKAPFLSNALKQPFSTTGTLSSLMEECERKANSLIDKTGGLDSLVETCPQYEGLFLMKETQAAFELWAELRTNVHTPSSFPDFLPTKRRKMSSGSGDLTSPSSKSALDDNAPSGSPAARAVNSDDAAMTRAVAGCS